MRIILPDCYGTAHFLAHAPDWVADWTGARPDSKDPIEGTEELIAWWREKGRDPAKKLVILSDGMDIDSIEETARRFKGRCASAMAGAPISPMTSRAACPMAIRTRWRRSPSSARSSRPMAARR